MKCEIFICDVCGVTKKETNHWWDVFVEQPHLSDPIHLEIHPFDAAAEDEHSTVCGEQCVVALISRFLAKGELK